MTWLILAIVAVAVGSFLAYRAGKRSGARALTAPRGASAGELAGGEDRPRLTEGGPVRLLDRTVADLRVDDVVQYDGRDLLVEGVLEYEEDGHTWRGARMVDGATVSWLVVNLDRGAGTDVRVLAPAADVTLEGYPPDTLTRGDTTFTLASRGNANVVVHGELGELPGAEGLAPGASVRCRYWKYVGVGDRALLVEEYGGQKRALVGKVVPLDQLELLPAS